MAPLKTLASFPGPHPASHHLQYGILAGEGLVHFLTWVTSQTGQIMRTWASCKPQNFTCTHALEHDSSGSKDGSARRRFYVALHEIVGRTESFLTVKTHSNNLVVLAHVQLKSFYCLSTRDVTHVRKCTRPSPTLPYCKWQEAGQGPGNEAMKTPELCYKIC